MLAVIRLRFPQTAASEVWSDTVMNNWLNPLIPNSLAHFWSRTSLFQADMSYFLFPAIVLADPRTAAKPGDNPRQLLVEGVLKEVSRLYSPDWNVFQNVLIVGAQATDQFGGGPYKAGDKLLLAAVVDVLSPFSNICQEVGHAFGLAHELNLSGVEYQSPYSVMSSELYGNNNRSSFERPVDTRLPVGKPVPPNVSAVVTQDVQRIIGPHITPVQFSIAIMGSFNDPATVHIVPNSVASSPHTFRLTALDAGIDAWPSRRVILGIVPPLVNNGEAYYLELRRNRSYDAAFSVDGTTTPPVAVVIHAVDLSDRRVRYVNRVPLVTSNGDTDYHDFRGHFAIRINSVEKDFSACSVTVGGSEFWKYFGINFEDVVTSLGRPTRIDPGWQTADMSPCFMFPPAPHKFRNIFENTNITIKATSFGYEQPVYQWFLNDQKLDPGQTTIKLKVFAKTAVKGEFAAAKEENIKINYALQKNSNRLLLNCDEPFSDISAIVKVVVNEGSHEVLQNFYPERSMWTGIEFNNVVILHDQAYIDEVKACAKRSKDLSDEYTESRKVPHRVDPGPRFGVDVINVIDALVLSNPTAANAVINEVARLGNVGKKEVIKQLK